MKPNSIPAETQLALILYLLAHDYSLSTLEDVFGWSISTNDQTFNPVCRILVEKLYDQYVKPPSTGEEWRAEAKGFFEKYEFLKTILVLRRYSISNTGLVGFNKRFLYATVGAPGSTHDARLLRHISLFNDILNGDAIPDKYIELDDFETMPLVPVGDNAFSKFA